MSDATLRLVPSSAERDAYLPLFHLADDSVDLVRGYYQTGTLFALDAADGTPIGMILVIPANEGTVELKAVAVDASSQGHGVGTRLLAAVLEQLRVTGYRRVIVGTSSSGIGQLAYYQKGGFRLWKIQRDYFTRSTAIRTGSRRTASPSATWSGWIRNSTTQVADRRPQAFDPTESHLHNTTSRGRAMSAAHVQADFELMQEIETAVARNLEDYVTAYRQVVPHAGAACIQVAGGVAAFTGINSPLTTVKGTGAGISRSDLNEIEAFFLDHDVTTVTVEMAPWLSEESKQILSEHGYRVAGQEDVVATTSGTSLPRAILRAEAIPLQAWLELMRVSSELPNEPPTNELVNAAARLPNAQLYGLRDNDRWIACAQSVTYGAVVIFGNDGTLPEARRRGAQTALIEKRLHALPPGKIVMAEVASGSGSERNYLRCGFQIAYTRAHYGRTVC